VLIIEALFLVHLFSAFPIFNYLSRNQILLSFYPDGGYPKWLFYGYTVVYLFACLAAQLANFNPGTVICNYHINNIAFDGAVCGFFMIYIVPISLHMKCYYSDATLVEDSLPDDSGLLVNPKQRSDTVSKYDCVEHPTKSRLSKLTRCIIYGLFICVGLFNMGI
jgi:sodium-coupled neutral amino acid transporter 9